MNNKLGATFKEQANTLLNMTLRDDSTKKDFNTKGGNLLLGLNGDKVVLKRKGQEHKAGLFMTEGAMTQLLTRYGIDVRETKKIFKSEDMQHKKLMAEYVNCLMENDKEELLIRSRMMEGRGLVRAILTDNYTELNNTDIVKTFINQVNSNKLDAEIQNVYITDDAFNFRAVFNGYDRKFGDENRVGDIIKSGIDTINSETGRSSFMLEPMVYRLICSNGLKTWRRDGEITKQRHAFISSQELNGLVIKGISDGIKSSQAIMNNMEQSKIEFADNPVEIIKQICQAEGISKKLTKEVISAYYIEPMKSMFGVINAFTRAAKEQKNDKQHEIEMLAGRILTDKKILVRA